MPEVVAAIESNWLGDEQLAFRMIDAVKMAGADKVKMQMYTADQVKDHPKADVLLRTIVDEERARLFKHYANTIDIEWFATPFYPEAVTILERLGVKTHKIREKDSFNMDLINKVLATQKPVYISTQTLPIDVSLLYHPQIKWLKCYPNYPMTPEDLEDFFYVDFEVYGGFSSHSPDVNVPILALARRAETVEVHYIHAEGQGPDAPVSLTFTDLSLLCKLRDFINKVKGLERVL